MARKFFIVSLLLCFVLIWSTNDDAAAGEMRKIKSHGSSYTTVVHQLEVGDEEGHILLIFENRAVYFDELTGEKFADRGVGFMDLNPSKPAQIYNTGYGVHTDKDGDKLFRSWKGRPVSKAQWKGVWSVTGGTGKYAGASGSGSWKSDSVAPKQSYLEVEGDVEMP